MAVPESLKTAKTFVERSEQCKCYTVKVSLCKWSKCSSILRAYQKHCLHGSCYQSYQMSNLIMCQLCTRKFVEFQLITWRNKERPLFTSVRDVIFIYTHVKSSAFYNARVNM